MRMREDDRIEHLGIERKLVPVAQPEFLQALKETAIDQDAPALGTDQKAAAGDGPGATQKSQHRGFAGLHSDSASACASSGATLMALVRCAIVSHDTSLRIPAFRISLSAPG